MFISTVGHPVRGCEFTRGFMIIRLMLNCSSYYDEIILKLNILIRLGRFWSNCLLALNLVTRIKKIVTGV
ncbi:hypothetical protein NQ315_010693 [Exocentrus adspersus]|uniref:Uncharacterized protein n=1 Tax=Exocentrus adspersus TaxID=1586481 RepID=A0AAV8VUP1_9CUCU|nr:hypothetical protein NQ315_010693 [Exocentrus adspersus]